jgi:uncharacterized protein (DUF1501 family)
MKLDLSRRQFLGLGSGTLVSSALLSSLGSFERVWAATADTSGYKALVCLYMVGGNNGFNWFVPLTPAGYSVYANSRSNLALASSSLLALNGTASDGYTYGIHPSCPELRTLFNAGHAAVLSNVGTLVQPTTPAQASGGSVPLPPQLLADQYRRLAQALRLGRPGGGSVRLARGHLAPGDEHPGGRSQLLAVGSLGEPLLAGHQRRLAAQ